jgi:hypothetical protein
MKTTKKFQLVLVLMLTVSVTITANLAYAQGSVPSVPQFTLQYVNSSYTTPPTYTTNPYTGQTTETSSGTYVNNETIVVTIQNQPFTPYTSGNNTNQLYYNVRCKGHFAQFTSDTDLGNGQGGIAASTSADTVVSFDIASWGIPSGGQVDFQVQAFIGYTYYNEGECFTANVVTVGESAWSNTQTITIGTGAVSTSTPSPPVYTSTPSPSAPPPTQFQSPTATPIPPGAQKGILGSDWQQTALIVMAVAIAVLVIALAAVILHKTATKKIPTA